MTILVIGGAGYIGSHIAKLLSNSEENTVIFDNLSTGHKRFVLWSDFVYGDIRNLEELDRVFESFNIDAVIHLGDLSIVEDSIFCPENYYRNNVIGLMNILECMHRHAVKKIIYSSSASVYGTLEDKGFTEDSPLSPVSPYGRTKCAGEYLLEDFFVAHDISSISFRYFNAAGADFDADIGELHENETHLIPRILLSLTEKHYPFKIYGNDYSTRDGTCIRDFVHVLDIAQAHLLALEFLQHRSGSYKLNLGSTKGRTIMEVIKMCETVTGKKVDYKVVSRRPGDPPILIANSSSAKNLLKWVPRYSDLKTIIKTAWNWHLKVNELHGKNALIPLKSLI